MKQHEMLAFSLSLALAGCGEPTPVVVLDGWWNADFARETCRHAKEWSRENAALIGQAGCERVASCREMLPIVEACAVDPVQDVRRFENDLATEFASSAECHSVHLVHFGDPKESSRAASDAMQKAYYSLSLDFKPGARKQQWRMLSPPTRTAFTQGEGTPPEIAGKVCFIVKEQGATLAN